MGVEIEPGRRKGMDCVKVNILRHVTIISYNDSHIVTERNEKY